MTVKGLAEREVKADTAAWTIRFTAAAEELGPAYAKNDADKGRLMSFLAAESLEDAAPGRKPGIPGPAGATPASTRGVKARRRLKAH